MTINIRYTYTEFSILILSTMYLLFEPIVLSNNVYSRFYIKIHTPQALPLLCEKISPFHLSTNYFNLYLADVSLVTK